MDERTNILISKLTEEQIEAFSDEEIQSIAMDRPGHPGHRGFLLDPRCYPSPDKLVMTKTALMKRLGRVDEEKTLNKGDNNEQEVTPEDLLASLNLSEFGIDEKMIDLVKPMIPKLIFDVVRGVPRFAAEEKFIQDTLQGAAEKKSGLLIQSIFSVRTFLLTTVGFSLTIMGVVLSVLSSEKNLFGSSILLHTGLVLLGVNIIGSVAYILYIHTLEGNWLLRQLNFDKSLSQQLKELIGKYYLDPTKTFDEYLIEKKNVLKSRAEEERGLQLKNPLAIKGKDWVPHLVSICFLLGVLLIVTSFFWH